MLRLTDDQMDELKRHIAVSPDATETTKKIILWMLDQTENMSMSVVLFFPPELATIGKQAVEDVHWMVSFTRKTHIQRFIVEHLKVEYPEGSIFSRSTDMREHWHGWIYIGDGERKSLIFDYEEVQKITLPS